MQPIQHRWELEVQAPLRRVWTAVSDTDRFNRAAGFGFRFEERRGEDGRIERIGRLSKFGVEVRWREEPFVIRAPHHWVNTRVFANGPLERVQTTCTLESHGETTRIVYEVSLWPRTWLARPIVAVDTNLTTRPALDRTLKSLVRLLEQGEERFDPPTMPLSDTAWERLHELDGLQPEAVVEDLKRTLSEAPLVEQDRLQPLRFAARHQADPEATVRAFLEGVRRGVLELRWELLCPSCRAPKVSSSQLTLGAEAHCSSCGIVYDGSFADSVEVVFRPDSAIREVEVEVECLLSPARTPHIVSQLELEQQASASWQIELEPGAYRLSTGPMQPGASLEVREGIPSDTITVDVEPDGLFPPVLRVAPGPVHLHLRSRRTGPVWIRLERRDRDPAILTAGRLLELPDARDLLPPEAVHPGIEVRSRRGAVLAHEDTGLRGHTETFDMIEGNGARIEVFETFAEALDRAELLADSGAAIGISVGPIVTLEQGGHQMPSGATVDEALRAARALGANRVALAARVAGDDEVREALAGVEHTLGPVLSEAIGVQFASSARAYSQAVLAASPPGTTAYVTIGPYLVGEELGRGGMGKVLAATDPQGRQVVVKLLLPAMAAKPDNAQRFYNEARLTSQVEHPNVVHVYDYGTIDGRMYLVMERLKGRELAEVEVPLDPDETRRIGAEVLAGLEAAHARGIVHRDIKPANLFLLDDGGVKIIDFGIAIPMTRQDDPEVTEVLGTPRYMSPEQVERDPIDGRSDLYSLGLVLYECLVGDIPFQAPTALTLAYARVREPPEPLPESIDPQLAATVMRALELDPPRRFDDAHAMREALLADG